jgi:hypothetical protein
MLKSQRRALKLLASSADGVTEGLLLANRVTTETLLELVNAGYATAHVDKLGRPRIEVARLRITPAGLKAIG